LRVLDGRVTSRYIARAELCPRAPRLALLPRCEADWLANERNKLHYEPRRNEEKSRARETKKRKLGCAFVRAAITRRVLRSADLVEVANCRVLAMPGGFRYSSGTRYRVYTEGILRRRRAFLKFYLGNPASFLPPRFRSDRDEDFVTRERTRGTTYSAFELRRAEIKRPINNPRDGSARRGSAMTSRDGRAGTESSQTEMERRCDVSR